MLAPLLEDDFDPNRYATTMLQSESLATILGQVRVCPHLTSKIDIIVLFKY